MDFLTPNSLYLCIDQGGHASRLIIYNHDGELVTSAYCDIETEHPAKHFVEHDANELIEEFMLAANEAVAETLETRHYPALYRIHEPPDDVKVLEFTSFSRTLGLHLPDNTGSHKWFGKILSMVAGTPKEYIVNNILLRTMQRARYSNENVWHFGFAATHYTHFTSPIRRYPYLTVHRTLANTITQQTC